MFDQNNFDFDSTVMGNNNVVDNDMNVDINMNQENAGMGMNMNINAVWVVLFKKEFNKSVFIKRSYMKFHMFVQFILELSIIMYLSILIVHNTLVLKRMFVSNVQCGSCCQFR